MKKIVTLLLLCGATMMLAASQLTVLPMLELSQDQSLVANSQVSKPALPIKICQTSKHALSPAAQQAAPLSQVKPLRLAQQDKDVTMDTLVLEGGKLLLDPMYEKADTMPIGEWYTVVEAEGYTFRLCWYGDEDDYAGTYGVYDISWDWTWGWFTGVDHYRELVLSDVTMTISHKQLNPHHSQIILDATITDTNDRVYVLHVVHDSYTPKSTVASELKNAKIFLGEKQYTLKASDANLDVQLAVNAFAIEGFYTEDDLDASASKIIYKGVEQDLLQATLEVVSGELANGSVGYLTQFSFFNQDTVLHKVLMPAPLPDPLDTIRTTCTNLEVDDMTFAAVGLVYVTASNKLYDFIALYEAPIAEEGVYKNVSLTIADKRTWIEAQAITATMTLTEETDGWHIWLEAYGADYKRYEVDMSLVIPVPVKTVNVRFEQTASAVYNLGVQSMLQLLHDESNYYAAVTVINPELDMTFSKEDLSMDYTFVYDNEKEREVSIADIQGKIYQRGTTTFIEASVIGFDSIQYNLQLWYKVPEPIETIELEMEMTYVHALDDGYYTLKGYTPDSVWYVSLSPIASKVPGTYINDGMFGKFGAQGGHYEIFSYGSFITENSTINHTIEKGEIKVNMSLEGKITALADVIAKNGKRYLIKIRSQYNTHLDFDEPEIEVDRTYTIHDEVFIEDQTEKLEYIYLSLAAADGSDQAAFFFYVDEADPEIVIPPGVYTIDKSKDYGTVAANPGVQGNGVWPSYYAQYDASGNFIVPLWLLVEGTVEVTIDDNRDPHLEVNAKNSYGVSVHIVFDGTRTALDHITTPSVGAEKRLQDGQLYIIRQDKVYNVLGQGL